MNKQVMFSLDFLAWVNRCLFVGDFAKELVEAGADELLARTWEQSLAKKSPNGIDIMYLYQEWCIGCDEYTELLINYLTMMQEKYNKS